MGGFRGGGRACAGCIRGAAGSRCRSSIFHTTCRRPPAAPPPAPCPPHAHSHPTRSPPAARHSLRPGELFSLRIVFSERYPLEPPEVRGGGGVRACGRGGTGGGGARGHRGAGSAGSGHGDSGRAAAQHTMCKGLLRWRHDRDGSRPFGAAEPPPPPTRARGRSSRVPHHNHQLPLACPARAGDFCAPQPGAPSYLQVCAVLYVGGGGMGCGRRGRIGRRCDLTCPPWPLPLPHQASIPRPPLPFPTYPPTLACAPTPPTPWAQQRAHLPGHPLRRAQRRVEPRADHQ